MNLTSLESLNGTVVIADDHALLRDGVKQIIASLGALSIVGEAADGLEAIAMVRRHRPTLLMLDIAMPYAQGIEIYTEVRRWSPDTLVVVFTGLTSARLLSELVTAGVDGLFMKRGDPARLAESLPLILNGARVIAPEILEFLETNSPSGDLTDRERQIVSLVAAGNSNREIAERLGISPKTVDNHRTNLMRKLGVHSVAELLSYALREGYLDGAGQL